MASDIVVGTDVVRQDAEAAEEDTTEETEEASEGAAGVSKEAEALFRDDLDEEGDVTTPSEFSAD
jgi:hypothetical protein